MLFHENNYFFSKFFRFIKNTQRVWCKEWRVTRIISGMSDDYEVVKKFSKKLRKLREKNGLTQEKLAEIADISYKNVQYLESKNPTCPNLITLNKLAKAFNINLSKLLSSVEYLLGFWIFFLNFSFNLFINILSRFPRVYTRGTYCFKRWSRKLLSRNFISGAGSHPRLHRRGIPA